MTATLSSGEIKMVLGDAFDNRTLTAQVLIEAICTTDMGGPECIPQSVGLSWLSVQFGLIENEAKYKSRGASQGRLKEIAMVREHQLNDLIGRLPDMTTVFFACLGSEHIGVVLQCKWFFGLIAEDRRREFFEQAFARSNPNDYWVRTALELGLPREFLAQQVLDKLAATTINPQYNTATFLSDFLRHGAGSGESVFVDTPAGQELQRVPTVWSLLTDEQLLAALEICANKLPAEFLRRRHLGETLLIEKLSARLSRKEIIGSIIQALIHHGGLDNVDASVFGYLDLETRRWLIDHMSGSEIALLVQVARELPAGGLEFFTQHVAAYSVRGHGTLCDQFIRLQPTLADMSDTVLAAEIRQTLLINLKSFGWLVGTVQADSYRGRLQYEVTVGGRKYVDQSNYGSRDYYPHEGDRVIFLRPTRGGFVSFRLLERPKKK